MPYAQRIASVGEDERLDIRQWLAKAQMSIDPIQPGPLGLLIAQLFHAYDMEVPRRKETLHLWFEHIGNFPEWVVRQAVEDTVSEVVHKPQIADVKRRCAQLIGGTRVVMAQAEALLAHGYVYDEQIPKDISPERQREVQEMLAAIGIKTMPRPGEAMEAGNAADPA